MKSTFPFLFLTLFFLQCSTATNDIETIETEHFTINNNEDELSDRVLNPDTEVPIDTSMTGGDAKRKTRFTLRLKSEVSPPTINGQPVQTTMVTSDGSSRTVVAYNLAGSPYVGAVDIAQIVGSGKITIRSNISFENTDINAVTFNDETVIAATATSDAAFREEESASSIQKYRVNGFEFTGDEMNFQALNSFVATSVSMWGDQLYVTTGNTGGLFIFDDDLDAEIAYQEISEARWVDVNDDYVVVLAGDHDNDRKGEIILIDHDDHRILKRYPFNGAYTPESKNTVELVEHLAFIAAGKEGMKIMDLTNGEVVASLDIPDPSSLGLSADVVATNAVSVDDELIFISNGEAGIYVAEGSKEFDTVRPGESVNISLLGRLAFDDLESANHVYYKSKIVTVAAGRGGIKSIEVRYKN